MITNVVLMASIRAQVIGTVELLQVFVKRANRELISTAKAKTLLLNLHSKPHMQGGMKSVQTVLGVYSKKTTECANGSFEFLSRKV